MRIKNITAGIRVVETTTGKVYLRPGEARDLEIADDVVAYYMNRRNIFVLGDGVLSDQTVIDSSEIEALRAENAQLRNTIDALRSEIRDLTDSRSPSSGVEIPEEYRGIHAKHRGGGSYSIMDASGERELVQGMNKGQVEEFNSKSDFDRYVWVKQLVEEQQ